MSDDEYSSTRLFHPSMAIQRYVYLRNRIQLFHDKQTSISSVLDLGCHDCSFVRFLKQLPFLRSINCLDIDESILQNSHYNARPMPMDLLSDRAYDLSVNLFSGSALTKDSRLQGIDVVTGIEFIEHLQPDVLAPLVENIFGFVCPQLVILTTPNYEYNWIIQRALASDEEAIFKSLFEPERQLTELKQPSFRDTDHKFEWTRAEFANWCEGIVSKYPNYCYDIDGVGILQSDEGNKAGFCTQIAIFTKKTTKCSTLTNAPKAEEVHKLYRSYAYKKNVHSIFPQEEEEE